MLQQLDPALYAYYTLEQAQAPLPETWCFLKVGR